MLLSEEDWSSPTFPCSYAEQIVKRGRGRGKSNPVKRVAFCLSCVALHLKSMISGNDVVSHQEHDQTTKLYRQSNDESPFLCKQTPPFHLTCMHKAPIHLTCKMPAPRAGMTSQHINQHCRNSTEKQQQGILEVFYKQPSHNANDCPSVVAVSPQKTPCNLTQSSHKELSTTSWTTQNDTASGDSLPR